jgi:CDGSH-type Zn-finger protein
MQCQAETKPRIKIQENGSYLVTGGPKLTTKIPVENAEGERIDWADGKDYPDKNTFSLCRCGHSKNKPYCDSSHREKDFDGTLTADRTPRADREKIYSGEGITMTDDESICAGFAYCDCFGSVWAEIEQTDNPAVKERLEKQISKCPSGRLQYFLNDNPEPIEIKYEPTIACIPDGPLWVLGKIPVEAPDGFVYEIRNRLLLCRCGHSGNKPFCDGTHVSIGFKTD